ncbi:unnamed protein product, partial [Polarella glacialis]
ILHFTATQDRRLHDPKMDFSGTMRDDAKNASFDMMGMNGQFPQSVSRSSTSTSMTPPGMNGQYPPSISRSSTSTSMTAPALGYELQDFYEQELQHLQHKMLLLQN